MNEQTQARILLIPSNIGLAHLGRLVLVAAALRRHGCAVAFAYGGRHGDLLARHGYLHFPVGDIPEPDLTVPGSAILEHYTEQIVERCVRDELAVYGEYQPHVVVTDLRPTAVISTRLAGIPHVAVLNGSATSYFDMARLLIEPDGRPLKYRLTGSLMRRLVAVQGRRLATGLRTVAERHGVSGRRTLFDFFTGDLNLLADLPGFVPLRPVPDNYRTVGPLIWEGDGACPPQLPPLAEGQRRIYVTVGNTGSRRVLDTAVEAFADQPQFQIIATTGAYLNPAAYRGQPHFHAFPFLPGSSVMRRSDLVIHAGGNGTTYQCLLNGLPALIVPANNEQIVAARLLRYHRVGVPLSLHDLSPARLLDLTVRLLDDPAYRQRARAFQSHFSGIDGAREAARQILTFLSQRTGHPQSLGTLSLVRQQREQTSAAV